MATLRRRTARRLAAVGAGRQPHAAGRRRAAGAGACAGGADGAGLKLPQLGWLARRAPRHLGQPGRLINYRSTNASTPERLARLHRFHYEVDLHGPVAAPGRRRKPRGAGFAADLERTPVCRWRPTWRWPTSACAPPDVELMLARAVELCCRASLSPPGDGGAASGLDCAQQALLDNTLTQRELPVASAPCSSTRWLPLMARPRRFRCRPTQAAAPHRSTQ